MLSSAELIEQHSQLRRQEDALTVDPALYSESLLVLLWAEHRMPYHCVAYGCGKTAEDRVTLFKFPKDHEEFRKWEKQVQRTRANWVATPNSHLCSEHFGKEYFELRAPAGALKLKPGAAPTVFVRPHCSSCSGVGCSNCLPAIQRRSVTAEPRERTVSVNRYYGGSSCLFTWWCKITFTLSIYHCFFSLHRQKSVKWRPWLMTMREEFSVCSFKCHLNIIKRVKRRQNTSNNKSKSNL